MTADPRHQYRWQLARKAILPRPGSRPCHWCGAAAVEVDHLIPVKLGGTDDLANLVPACLRCNRSKGAKSTAEWRRRQGAVPVWRAYGSRRARIF
jgi:5-methylcytosine-specific restriction endonuclease McrA